VEWRGAAYDLQPFGGSLYKLVRAGGGGVGRGCFLHYNQSVVYNVVWTGGGVGGGLLMTLQPVGGI